MERRVTRVLASSLAAVLVALTVTPGALAVTPERSAGAGAPAASMLATADDPVVPDPGYSDVDGTNTFFDDIAWLANEGITTGFPDGSFQPSGTVTRQAFAAFLFRLDGQTGGGACTGAAPFPDVAQANPFCSEIAWLSTQGIAAGYADGGFHPSALISRQAMGAFLYRYDHTSGDTTACLSDAGPFPDVPADVVFCEAVRWMSSVGPQPIATGYADGGFHPTSPISRQAMAAFLHRYRAHTPAPFDTFQYELHEGTVEVAHGDVLSIARRTVVDPTYDADGNMLTAPEYEWDVTLAAGATAPNVGDGFFLQPGLALLPDGLAGRVTDRSADGDGVISLVVAQDDLDYLFDYLHIAGAGAIPDDAYAATVADLNGASSTGSEVGALGVLGSAEYIPQAIQPAGNVLGIHCEDTGTGADLASLKTEFSFGGVTNRHWDKDIELGWKVVNKRIRFTFSGDLVVTSKWTLEGPAGKVSAECTPPSSWFNAVRMIIPVGEGITIGISPYFKFGGSIEGSLTQQDKYSFTKGFDASLFGGLKLINDLSEETSYTAGQVGITAFAEVGIQLDVGILSIAGIFGKFGLRASVDAYFKYEQLEPNQLCAEEKVGITGSLGVFVDIKVARWEYVPDVLDGELDFWKSPWPKCITLSTGGTSGGDSGPPSGGGSGFSNTPPTPDPSWSPPAGSGPSAPTVPQRFEQAITDANDAIAAVARARVAANDALAYANVAVSVAGSDPDPAAAAAALVDQGTALLARVDAAESAANAARAAAIAANTLPRADDASSDAWDAELAAGGIVVDATALERAIQNLLYDILPWGPKGDPTPFGGASGAVWSFGPGDIHTWGDPDRVPYLNPVRVPDIPLAASMAVSDSGTRLVGRDGTVWTWAFGSQPTQVAGLSSIEKAFVCGEQTYAVTAGGDLYGWGVDDGVTEILGDGGTSDTDSGVPISGVSNVAQLECDYLGDVAVRTDSGEVWVWGPNAYGHLDGNQGGGAIVLPLQISGIDDAIDVALGPNDTCVVRSDGTVWCWGNSMATVDTDPYNPDYSLGLWEWRSVPTQIVRVSDAVDVVMGINTWYVRTSAGDVWAWGLNYGGRLGDGTTGDRMVPIKIAGISDVAEIKAQWDSRNSGNVYALKTDGTVWDWGDYASGLGQGTMHGAYEPAQVPRIDGIVKLDVTYGNVYALDSGGTLWFWGDATDMAAVGYDRAYTDVSMPMAVTHVDNVGDFAAAWYRLYLWAH